MPRPRQRHRPSARQSRHNGNTALDPRLAGVHRFGFRTRPYKSKTDLGSPDRSLDPVGAVLGLRAAAIDQDGRYHGEGEQLQELRLPVLQRRLAERDPEIGQAGGMAVRRPARARRSPFGQRGHIVPTNAATAAARRAIRPRSRCRPAAGDHQERPTTKVRPWT
jgi:hypothetical protein